jgi:hypothetical protein
MYLFNMTDKEQSTISGGGVRFPSGIRFWIWMRLRQHLNLLAARYGSVLLGSIVWTNIHRQIGEINYLYP